MASWSDKFTQVTQNAISKSKEVAGVAKLNMEISSLNQEIKNIQTQAGAYVLDNGFLPANPYIADWIEKVNGLKAEIAAKNEKIMELKNVVVCSKCGREVSRSNRFCEHCGAEIVISRPESESVQEVAAATPEEAEPAEVCKDDEMAVQSQPLEQDAEAAGPKSGVENGGGSGAE